MEDLDKLESIAYQNLELAKSEKELAKKINLTGIRERKRAEVRKDLAQKNFKLNDARDELVENYEDLINKKMEIKNEDLLGLSDAEITFEEDYSTFFDLINEIQAEIIKIQLKIVDLELKIAADKIKISHEVEYAAKEREKLGNMQIAFLKAVKSKSSEKKINRLEEKYKTIHNTLIEDRKDILKDLRILKLKEIDLADLKKEYSEKLSQREKIRPKILDYKK
jgi:hypothetical protein